MLIKFKNFALKLKEYNDIEIWNKVIILFTDANYYKNSKFKLKEYDPISRNKIGLNKDEKINYDDSWISQYIEYRRKQNEELLKDNMRLRMERNLGQHSNNQKSQKNLLEDNQILSQQIIDLKNELEYWKKNQTNNKSKRDHSNDENVHYKHEYEKLKERNRKLSKEMSHLQTQFKEKLESVAKKADKFETDKNELLSNLDIFNNKVENLEYELDKAAEDKKNL